MNDPLPPLGAFLRPVGILRYGYCIRVMQQFDPAEDKNLAFPAIEYERWGIRDGQPFDDGNVRRGSYIDLLPAMVPGVWRPAVHTGEIARCIGYRRGDEGPRWCQPSRQLVETYYRLMPLNSDGQMELFT
ncbi:MAG: hypothetical protein ACN6OD_19105 [Alcaligenes sp.]